MNIVLSSVVQWRASTLSLQLQIDLRPIMIRIGDVQITVDACCDFISQCIIVRINHSICHPIYSAKIFKDLPLLDCVGSKYSFRDYSFNLVNHILRSVNLSSFDEPITIYRLYLATWLALAGAPASGSVSFGWWDTLELTGLATAMAVNTLVTGLIVFRILKVFKFLGVKPTSVERSLGSTSGTKFRHIVFVIIESGMALFAIQLVRVVIYTLPVQAAQLPTYEVAIDFVIAINQMLNVIIIRSVHFYFFCFADNIYLARGSHQR